MKLTMTRLLLIVSSIQILLFVGLIKVNALQMNSISLNNNVTGMDSFDSTNGYFKKAVNFTQNWTNRFTFTEPIDITGWDYVQFPFLLQYSLDQAITENSDTTLGNSDTRNILFCSSWVQRQQTYADGTSSTYYVCNTWAGGSGSNISTNTSGAIDVVPNIGIAVDIVLNQLVSPCEINNVNMGITYATCKIPSSQTSISNIRFRNVGSQEYTNGIIGIGNFMVRWKDMGSLQIQNDNTNTQNIINNNTQNAQDIQDGINNADYNGPTEQPNSSDFNSAHSTEQDLKGLVTDNTDLSVLNVGIDVQSSNWVWNTLTSLIQANSVVFGMFISILSVGILKLALGR